MLTKVWLAFLAAIGLAAVSAADARAGSVLYGATGSNGVEGSLVILNPESGSVLRTIGQLVDSAGNHYGITGMAFDPATGVLYGSTANRSPTAPGSLVTIDPDSGMVDQLGSFGVASTMADLTFDPTSGLLYGWQSAGDQSLYTIDLDTGLGTRVGISNVVQFGGGGLAADSAGNIFVSPNGATGDLDTVDKLDGHPTLVASLSGAPFPNGGLGALAFDSDGTLYGSNTNQGSVGAVHIVTIDVATGAITDRGVTVNNLDAIAFRPASVPEPSSFMLSLAAATATLFHAARRLKA